MAEEATTTPEVEVKTPEAETTVETTPTVEVKQTISEMLGDKPEKVEDPKTIGLDKFLHEKKERKALEKEVKDLRKLIEEGGNKEEISESLSELSEEYPDVDPKFLQKLAKTIKAETEKGFEEKLSSKFKPIEEKERGEKLKTVFNKNYTEAIETMPEYKKVVNENVIFKLSLLPENGDKTFVELIEETYSNALGGKRTLNTTTPGGGKEPEPLDVARAARDGEYFKQVMADPKLKEAYNRQMLLKGF